MNEKKKPYIIIHISRRMPENHGKIKQQQQQKNSMQIGFLFVRKTITKSNPNVGLLSSTAFCTLIRNKSTHLFCLF